MFLQWLNMPPNDYVVIVVPSQLSFITYHLTQFEFYHGFFHLI
jgi:predicted phosphoadenosine phosphosulfate sulfurtransferase